jgi:hypothetical protein
VSEDRWLMVSEAAKILNVEPSKIYTWMRGYKSKARVHAIKVIPAQHKAIRYYESCKRRGKKRGPPKVRYLVNPALMLKNIRWTTTCMNR